jgi:MoxR-like ATPase
MTQANDLEATLQRELSKVMFGSAEAIHALTIALLGRGHLLLEGAPGLGKTLLARSFATVVGGTFKRIQGTADLMPTDITGVHVFNSETRTFEFQPGPLFADVVLADELNRAGPKTQSALLEAMEERQVTVDRETFNLAEDFLVVATQNPRDFEGTYPLPESQLDRFMLSVPVSHVPREEELKILEQYNLPGSERGARASLSPLAPGAVQTARESLASVHLSEGLMGYVLDIATATRDNSQVSLGLSSRGALALARCARIEAWLGDRDYVVPDDVKRVACWVIGHRLVLSSEAILDGTTATDVLTHVLGNVEVPR